MDREDLNIQTESPEKECIYCLKNERLKNVMKEVCELKVSTLYLYKDQTYPGRCVVALNRHETELFSLDKKTLHLFSDDVSLAASALKRTFKPKKINYAIYGDLVPHLHYHVVPKFENGDCWGKPFNVNPQNSVILSDKEYCDMIEKILSHL